MSPPVRCPEGHLVDIVPCRHCASAAEAREYQGRMRALIAAERPAAGNKMRVARRARDTRELTSFDHGLALELEQEEQARLEEIQRRRDGGGEHA